MEPYAKAAGVALETDPLLSEEGAAPKPTAEVMQRLARELPRSGPLVVCSHRPVLPGLFAARSEPASRGTLTE